MSKPYLDADQIRASTFIRHVEIHDRLGSTNDRAAELARDTHIEMPALVAARLQTAGRGRGKNVWHAAEGALTFSGLLEPSSHGISTCNWPQLSLMTALAVCDALEAELNPQSESSSLGAGGKPECPRLGIKWPNDVMLDGRKIVNPPAAPRQQRTGSSSASASTSIIRFAILNRPATRRTATQHRSTLWR
jgi:BirA family biotin operon repressor/biotin-[acetyl-CoA-carboxylase] ligase